MDASQKSPIYKAVETCNVNAVKSLLKTNESIDNEPNILSLAINTSCNSIVKLLLEHGANINGQGSTLPPPIQCAVDVSNVEAVRLLLERNVSITNLNDLLPMAIDKDCKDIIDSLLNYKANINALDSTQKSPIYYAVKRNNLALVKLLLKQKVSVENQNELLYLAVRNKSVPIANLLLKEGVDINGVIDSEGFTAMHEAIKHSELKMAKLLLKKGANVQMRTKDGKSYLHYAARYPLYMFRLFLDNNIDTSFVDSNGDTALHTVAAIKNKHHFAGWLVNHCWNKVELINMKNLNGDTPLLIAARLGNDTNVEILLTFGANLECTDKDGNTALYLAACCNNLKSFEILLDHTPSIEDKINQEMTFFDFLGNESDVKSSADIKRSILKSVLKRSCANMYVREDLLSYFDKDIKNNSRKSIYFIEVNRMKVKKFEDSNISYLSLLQTNVTQIAKMFKNKTIPSRVEAMIYNQEFREYGEMISARLKYGKARMDLLDKINKHSYTLFYRLPHYCLQNVFNYLRNEDIRSLLSLI